MVQKLTDERKIQTSPIGRGNRRTKPERFLAENEREQPICNDEVVNKSNLRSLKAKSRNVIASHGECAGDGLMLVHSAKLPAEHSPKLSTSFNHNTSDNVHRQPTAALFILESLPQKHRADLESLSNFQRMPPTNRGNSIQVDEYNLLQPLLTCIKAGILADFPDISQSLINANKLLIPRPLQVLVSPDALAAFNRLR